MRYWILALTILAAALTATAPVAAQTDVTSPEQSGEPKTEVELTITGQILNRSDGAEAPGNLETMLHIWDADFSEKDMVHGVTDSDGRFVFDSVIYQPGLLYAVMTSYEDVTYFSPPMDVDEGQTRLEVEVPVFETTADVSTVQVDGMHIFFGAEQGGLLVGEVYTLSNLGDRTVVGAATLDDGTPATIRFNLPPDATNVTFQSDNSRFFLTSDGFADTSPLMPGERTGQVVVTYILPYTDRLTLQHKAILPTENVNVLLPPELGLSLISSDLVDSGPRDMGNGTTVDVYSLENLAAGDTISLDLSGKLALPGIDSMAGEVLPSNAPGLAIGGILLGLSIIGVGLWWYWRPVSELEEELPEVFDDIVQEIALLDAAYDQLDIEDDAYQVRRAALHEQARAVLAQGGD